MTEAAPTHHLACNWTTWADNIYRGGVLSPRHENGVQQFQDLVRAADADR